MLSKDKVLTLFLLVLATLAIGHTKVWFATETQHLLHCHGIGSAKIWYLNGTAVNDSSLFQILPSGTLRVTEITLDLDNSVIHCEDPNGAIISNYHIRVEASMPLVEFIYPQDKQLCWNEPQTFVTIVAYYIKIYNVTSHAVLWHGNQTTGTCITLEDMPELLECLGCGGCHVNITVEFWEDPRPRNGSTSTVLVTHESDVSVVNGSVQSVIINSTSKNISLVLDAPVCSLLAYYHGVWIPANWTIINSNYTEVSFLLTNTEGQTDSLPLEVNINVMRSDQARNLTVQVPIAIRDHDSNSAVASTSSTEGNVSNYAVSAVALPLLMIAAILLAGVILLWWWKRDGKSVRAEITTSINSTTTERRNSSKESEHYGSIGSLSSNMETPASTEKDSSHDAPGLVVAEQESQPLLSANRSTEQVQGENASKNAAVDIPSMPQHVQTFNTPGEHTIIQMESQQPPSSPCTTSSVGCTDTTSTAPISFVAPPPFFRTLSCDHSPPAESHPITTPHDHNVAQSSSVEVDPHTNNSDFVYPRLLPRPASFSLLSNAMNKSGVCVSSDLEQISNI